MNQIIDEILKAFEKYYDITRDVEPPFFAKAEFSSLDSHYFIIHEAKLAESDSNEFVYFACNDSLNLESLQELVDTSWQDGLAKVKPYNGHKNSDITLICVTSNLSDDVIRQAKKTRLSKSYKLSLYGYSNFKLVVVDAAINRTYYNRLGKDYKKVFDNIFN